MDGLTDFLAMGGYGAFVWPSFAIAALVMIVIAVASRRALTSAERQLATLETSDGGGDDA